MKNNTQEKEFNISRDLESRFVDFIREHLAIVVSEHQKKELRRTIKEACNKFSFSPEQYLNVLKISTNTSPFMDHLIVGVTIGETYFFRDKHQMDLIECIVLPNLIQKKRTSKELTLRIWSAGCATGEEIYTISMFLNKMLLDINDWNIHLLATDINPHALQKAVHGAYTEWSMRSTPKHYKDTYFKKENNRYILNPEIRNRVQFEYLNLHDDTFPSIINGTNAQDFILCRNVLIYFDMEYISELMKKFNKCLLSGGYLLLGASDPIIIKSTDFMYYNKESSLLSRSLEQPMLKVIETPKSKVAPIYPKAITSPVKEYSKKNEFSRVSKSDIDLESLQVLIADENWKEIIALTKTYDIHTLKSTFILNTIANAYANLGLLNEAVEFCKKSLELDSTYVQTHFTLAMIFIELNRLNDAENELRKALYLDHQFVNGHFQLGLLLIRMQQQNAGIKSLQNALRISKSKEPMNKVPGEEQLTYKRLTEILENEIKIYEN